MWSGAFIRPPDPHRCFSDLPTAPQGPFKGPKPREQTHRDFIEPWTGLGSGTGLSPLLATNGYAPRLTCIFPDCQTAQRKRCAPSVCLPGFTNESNSSCSC